MPPLDVLPDRVRLAARVYDNGEVAWSREDAEEAIRALGAANGLILGLDFRRDVDDGTYEIAWSAHDPDGETPEDVRTATEVALDDLRRGLAREDLSNFPWVLITWTDLG